MPRDIYVEQGAAERLPVIGVVPSFDDKEKLMGFPERYADAVVAAGGAPLLLPLSADPRVYETLFPLIDGFVLTGGNDIDPARYGTVADSGKITEHTPRREELEYLILSYAYRFDLPLLGICRGMQMINVCLGGTLYRDLGDQFDGVCPEAPGTALAHWQEHPYDRATHLVDIVPGTRLASLMGAGSVKVNSMHHQGVCEVSAKVRAAAFAHDGLVEAIEVLDRTFMVGVQWHPEFFVKKRVRRLTCVFNELVSQSLAAHGRPRGTVAISPPDNGAHCAGGCMNWPVITFAEYI